MAYARVETRKLPVAGAMGLPLLAEVEDYAISLRQGDTDIFTSCSPVIYGDRPGEVIHIVHVFDEKRLVEERETIAKNLEEWMNSETDVGVLARVYELYRYVTFRGFVRPENAPDEFYETIESVTGLTADEFFDPNSHLKDYHSPKRNSLRPGKLTDPFESLVCDYAYKAYDLTRMFKTKRPEIYQAFLKSLIYKRGESSLRAIVHDLCRNNSMNNYATHPDILSVVVEYLNLDFKNEDAYNVDELETRMRQLGNEEDFLERLNEFAEKEPVYTYTFPGRNEGTFEEWKEEGLLEGIDAVCELGSGKNCYVIKSLVKALNRDTIKVAALDPVGRPDIESIEGIDLKNSIAINDGLSRAGIHHSQRELWSWMYDNGENLAVIVVNVLRPHIDDWQRNLFDVLMTRPKMVIIMGGFFEETGAGEVHMFIRKGGQKSSNLYGAKVENPFMGYEFRRV